MSLPACCRSAAVCSRARTYWPRRSRSLRFERLETRLLLAGDSFASATALPAPDDLPFLAPGHSDYYVYTATATGYVTAIEQPAAQPGAGGMDTQLKVYDAAQLLLGTSNDYVRPDGTSVSQVTFWATSGLTYYVVAGSFQGYVGYYELSVTPDFSGHSFDTAVSIPLSPSGANSEPAQAAIAFPGDVNYYAFKADVTGIMTISQNWVPVKDVPQSQGLDSFLSVYDETERLVAFDDDSAGSNPVDSVVSMQVVAGDTYYLTAAAFPNPGGNGATGSYQLQLSTEPSASLGPGHSFTDPVAVNLQSASGPSVGPTLAGATATEGTFVRLAGEIQTLSGVNDYRFTASVTESIDVQLEPAAANGLEGYLYVFNGANQLVTSDYNDRLLHDSTDSTVQFNVLAGQTYYVQVAGFRGTVGAYDLTFTTGYVIPPPSDGLSRTFASAVPVPFDGTTPVTASGTIETPDDDNIFRFKIPGFGPYAVTIRELAAPGSVLDPYLYLFTDSGTLYYTQNVLTNEDIYAASDDADVLLGADGQPATVLDRNSALTVYLVGGETYYLKAAAFGSTTGNFFLSISPYTPPSRDAFGVPIGDGIGDVRNTVTGLPMSLPVATIGLSAGGTGSQSGTLEAPGQDDAFQFVAVASGLMTVGEDAAPGSDLDSYLYAFGPDRLPLASNNDSGGTYNSTVQFNVVAGQTYYIKAAGYGISTGSYVLSFRTSSEIIGHTFATAFGLNVTSPAAPIGPASSGAPASSAAAPLGLANGAIAAPGDVDFYQFRAPITGPVTIDLAATSGSGLDTTLYVFDASKNPIAFDNNAGPTTFDSQVTLDAVAGETYYIRAGGFATSVGAYVLTILSGGVPIPNAQTAALPIHFDPIALTADVFGDIAFVGDSQLYRFVAPLSANVIVTQEALAGSPLASYLFAYDDSYRVIGSESGTTIDPNDPRTIPDASVRLSLVAGQTYYLRAEGSANGAGDPNAGPTGAYRIRFTFVPDDFGNTFDEARTLPAPTTAQPTVQPGVIEQAGDTDMFQLLATATGRVDIQMAASAAAEPLLGCLVTVFDASGNEIAQDFANEVGTPVSNVLLDVTAGRLYYVQAAGYGNSTGPYTLTLTTRPPGAFGADFASADPVALSASGAGATDGMINADNPVNVFQFTAPLTGEFTVDVTSHTSDGLAVNAQVYTYINGVPTQVGGNPLPVGGGMIRFAAQQGQIYYLRVTAQSGAGPYHFSLTASPLASTADIARAGKAAYSALTNSYVAVAPFGGNQPQAAKQQADAITASLVQAFIASQALNGGVATDYFLLWTDPIDHIVFDSKQLASGYTGGLGTINENGSGYVSGAGNLQVQITPATLLVQGELIATYDLDLLGLGEGPVLFGASLILAGGKTVSPEVETATGGTAVLPADIALANQLAFVLDFGNPDVSGPAPPAPMPVVLTLTSLVTVTATARAGPSANAAVGDADAVPDPVVRNGALLRTATTARLQTVHAVSSTHAPKLEIPATVGHGAPWHEAWNRVVSWMSGLTVNRVVGTLRGGLEPVLSVLRVILSPAAGPAAGIPVTPIPAGGEQGDLQPPKADDPPAPADRPNGSGLRDLSYLEHWWYCGDAHGAAFRFEPPAVENPETGLLVTVGLTAVPFVLFDRSRRGAAHWGLTCSEHRSSPKR